MNWGQFLLVWLTITLGTTFYRGMYPAAVNLVDSLYDTYDRFELMDFQVQLAAPVTSATQSRAGSGLTSRCTTRQRR